VYIPKKVELKIEIGALEQHFKNTIFKIPNDCVNESYDCSVSISEAGTFTIPLESIEK